MWPVERQVPVIPLVALKHFLANEWTDTRPETRGSHTFIALDGRRRKPVPLGAVMR